MINDSRDNGPAITIRVYAFASYAQAKSRIVHARELGGRNMTSLDIWTPLLTEDIKRLAITRILKGGNLAITLIWIRKPSKLP